MATFARMVLGTCVALVTLTLFSSAALALRSVQVSNPGALRRTGVRVSFEEEGRFLRTVCEGLTLNGEGRERIAKIRGAAVGSITEGRTTGCTAFGFVRETITVDNSPASPANESYNAILGTLPNITGILILIDNLRLTTITENSTCHYGGTIGFLLEVAAGRPGGRVMERGSFLPEPKATLQAESAEACVREFSFIGSMRFERTRTITLV